jgi:hypothetical protein
MSVGIAIILINFNYKIKFWICKTKQVFKYWRVLEDNDFAILFVMEDKEDEMF